MNTGTCRTKIRKGTGNLKRFHNIYAMFVKTIWGGSLVNLTKLSANSCRVIHGIFQMEPLY